MRLSREGQFYEEKGYYCWRLRLSGRPAIVRKRRTQKELRAVVKQVLKELEERGDALQKTDREMTAGQYLDRWLKQFVEPNRAFKTHRQYEQVVRLYAKPHIGDRKLSSVNALHCQEMLNALRSQGLSPVTVNLVRTILKRAFGIAVKQRLILFNPMEATERAKVGQLKARAMPDEHLTAVLIECGRTITQKTRSGETRIVLAHRYGPMIAFLIGTGLRISEAMALTFKDLDCDCVRVERKLEWTDKGVWRTTVPKTPKSRRVVPLLSYARDAASAQRIQVCREMDAPAYQTHGLLFPSESGQPCRERNVQRALDSILEALELPHYSLHDLRRTYCTRHARLGTPVHITQALMGHENEITTLKHYSTPFQDDMAAAVANVDTLALPAGT